MDEFVIAVENMRKLQIEYFKTRSNLEQAKSAERQVDKMIVQIKNPSLFDGK